MGQAKHTPGPWIAKAGRIEAAHRMIASMHSANSRITREDKANAHLIVAAPDLLAEVKEFRRAVEYYLKREEGSGDNEGRRLKAIKLVMLSDLIARAEGGTNG